MGARWWVRTVAPLTGVASLVFTAPVAVHALVGDSGPPDRSASTTRVGAGRGVRPAHEPSTADLTATSTTGPASSPPADLGVPPAKPPPPVQLTPARPGDLTSWVPYLGPVDPMGQAESELAGAMFTWVNAERAAQDLPPLAWSGDLAHSSLWWSRHMVGYAISHSNLLGLLPERYSRTGENVGSTDPGDAAGLHQALRSSSDHLANMLDPRYDVISIGVACAPGGRLYVTQHFGASGADTPVEGRAPAWRPDADASRGPQGENGPRRCSGSRPASADPPSEDDPEPDPTTTTAPLPTTTSSSTSTTTSSSSTSTSTSTTSSSSSTSTSTSSTTTSSSSTSTSTTTTTTAR